MSSIAGVDSAPLPLVCCGSTEEIETGREIRRLRVTVCPSSTRSMIPGTALSSVDGFSASTTLQDPPVVV
jgi:hypothetical protein